MPIGMAEKQAENKMREVAIAKLAAAREERRAEKGAENQDHLNTHRLISVNPFVAVKEIALIDFGFRFLVTQASRSSRAR